MRLKSIEMQGFKSFADKITLDFNTGITAVVGPNGSGKSNIADAIKWVMGEQSVKSLRGSKMEDVIFAGTESRKALGFAEVSLTLDNTDGYFPLDFPEIRVTRRVYRSGDGEYAINKTPCRLKDIHELFMDTGLGRDGYSMIGQGKIDNILSTKSEDRRQIFEEAAGISKYKYRKIEAERKLAQTNDNLIRVRDILSELEGQLLPLQKQSEKARQYLKLRDTLKSLEIQVSVISIARLREELSGVEGDLDILLSQIAEIDAKVQQADAAVSKLYDTVAEHDAAMEDCRSRESELTEAIHTLQNQRSLLQSDIVHTEENTKRLNAEIEERRQRIAEADAQLQQDAQMLRQLQEQNDALDLRMNEQQAKAAQAGMDVGEKNTELEQIKNEIIEKTAAISSLRGSAENLNRLLESYTQRKGRLETELQERDGQFSSMTAALDKLDLDIAAQHDGIAACQEELRRLQETYAEQSSVLQQLQSTRDEYTLRVRQCASKRHMLEEMERAYDGYAKSVKSVMQGYAHGELQGAQIYGPLAQLIRTEPAYVTAIETALGAANQNIVTESEQDAKRAIQYLREKKLGRATFLPVRAIKGKRFAYQEARSMEGFLSVAADLVECDEKYRAVVSSLLGSTAIVDHLDHGIEIARKTGHRFRLVTLDGDVIQAGGAMTGGSVAKSVGTLSRSNEIQKLRTEEQTLKEAIAAAQHKADSMTAQLQELSASIAKQEAELKEKNEGYIRLCADRDHAEQNLFSVGETKEQLAGELTGIAEQIGALRAEIDGQTRQAETETEAVAQLEAEVRTKQQAYEALSEKNAVLSAALTELSIQKNALLKDIEMQNERIRRANDEKGGWMEEMLQRNREIEENQQNITAFGEQITQIERQLEQYRGQEAAAEKELSERTEQKRVCEAEIRRRQAETKETQETMLRLSQQQAKLEARKEKGEADLEGIISRMWEEYELTYSEALKLKQPDEAFDYTAASKQIRKLRNEIKELGNINIDAIEEYKAVDERFRFLKAQTEDLEKAKRELEEIITEMLGIMREQFTQQFYIINQNFSRVFSEMFGGGRANLTLSEPNNVLESGIEIEAQPPGKKLQSLTLLSGGERAFTAIALLFAILDVRPTPFCILDEIEAALDDVNVYRYADYLKQYSQKTQFIVVTHRRGTMEAANILYGVTMQERGISKLLALNIDEVKG